MAESDDINDEDFMAGLQAELGPVEPSKGIKSTSGGAPKPKPKQTSQDDEDGGLFGSKDDDDDGDDDDDDDDGLEDAEISMGDEGDTGAKGGTASAKGTGKSADGDAGGKDAQTTDAGGAKVRGLEDSAATRRGAAPAASPARGLEDSAANRKGGTPETMRERYGGTKEEEEDQGKGGSGTQGSKTSPFSALGATAATAVDDGDRPGVNVLTEPSIACGGVSAAEEDSKDLGNSGDGPPGAEDSFDLAPSPARPSPAQSVKSLQQPFKAVQQQQQQQQQQDQQQPAFRKPPTLLTETYSLDMDGTGSRPGTAVPPPGASETPREGRIDVDLGGQGGAAQAARRKEWEDRQAARYRKEAHKGITAEDFAKQEALDQLRGTDQKTGLTLPSVLELFQTYDQDRTGAINIVEFKDMLTDLDGLKSIESTQGKAKSTKTRGGRKEPEESPEDRYVRHEFERADLNGDQLVSIDEFYIYFYSTLCFKFPMLRTGVNPGADLLNIYMKYCSFGKGHRSEEMDCSQFAKLCHESGLLNGKTVTKATCDIVWFRARAELESLEAFKKKQNEYITPKMLYPQFLFALLYIAEKRRSGLQEVVSRILEKNSPLPMPSSADYLFRKNTGAAEQSEEYLERPRGLPRAPPNPMTLQMSERMRVEAALSKTLRRGTYNKEAGNLTTPRASCWRAHGGASASYEQDEDHEKKVDNSAKHDGLEPISYGGAAGNRVPTKGPLAEGKNVVSAERRSQWGLEPKEIKLSRHGAQALNDPVVLLEVQALKPDELIMGCRDVFTRFNQWEGGNSKSQMDKTRFVKCIRDAQLITEAPGCLTQTLVEDYFTKVLPPAQNTINFMRFVDALRHVATKLRTSLNYVMERLVVLGEPVTGLYLPTAADGRANADVRASAAK